LIDMADDSRKAVAVPGHPGIFKKGSRYQVRFRHHGAQRAKSFRTLTEAKRFRRDVEHGEAKPTTSRTFRAYATEWLDTYSGRTTKGLSATTRASYRDAVERVAIPFFGTIPLDRVDPPTLRRYVAQLAKGRSPATVRRYYAPVRALLATAYEDGLLKSNPAAGVRVIVKDTREKAPRWLTPEQTRALLAAFPAEHSDLALFLATTGCRISEALSARWQDFGPDDKGRIVIRITVSKTEAGIRSVPLSEDMAQRLARRWSEARYADDGDPIFASALGTVIDAHNWRKRVFSKAAKAAGVPWATPHKLRHGLASLMARERYSASDIAAHLGHADGGVLALRTYIHSGGLDSTDFIDSAFRVDPGVDPEPSVDPSVDPEPADTPNP
jgi:integrase